MKDYKLLCTLSILKAICFWKFYLIYTQTQRKWRYLQALRNNFGKKRIVQSYFISF
jgi:hypothetical protein